MIILGSLLNFKAGAKLSRTGGSSGVRRAESGVREFWERRQQAPPPPARRSEGAL